MHSREPKGRVALWAAAVVAGALFVAAPPARAYPGFARNYATSCGTCHTAYPKLNDFGRAFKWNGHQIPDDAGDGYVDDLFVSEESPAVPLGVPAWKKVFPDGLWPNSIWGSAPIGIQAQSRLIRTAGRQGSDGPLTDFAFPAGIGVMSAATLGEDISYWARLQFGTDSVEIERAFVTFTDLKLNGVGFFDEGFWDGLPDGVLNARIGKIEPGFLGYSNHVDRLTLTGYNVNGFSVTNNPWAAEPALPGVELWGAPSRSVMYVAGLTNGTPDRDNNSEKDGYARLAYKWGGIGFDGSPAGEGADDLRQTDTWQDDSITFGAFAYQGQNRLTDAATTQQWDDRFFRVGGDLRVTFGDLNCIGAVMYGLDRNALNATPARGLRSVAWYGEADYVVYPWLIPVVRYEYSDLDGKNNNINSVITSLTVMVRANVKLVAERQIFLDDTGVARPSVVLVALDVSF